MQQQHSFWQQTHSSSLVSVPENDQHWLSLCYEWVSTKTVLFMSENTAAITFLGFVILNCDFTGDLECFHVMDSAWSQTYSSQWTSMSSCLLSRKTNYRLHFVPCSIFPVWLPRFNWHWEGCSVCTTKQVSYPVAGIMYNRVTDFCEHHIHGNKVRNLPFLPPHGIKWGNR
jgi:hypothetical protein